MNQEEEDENEEEEERWKVEEEPPLPIQILDPPLGAGSAVRAVFFYCTS